MKFKGNHKCKPLEKIGELDGDAKVVKFRDGDNKVVPFAAVCKATREARKIMKSDDSDDCKDSDANQVAIHGARLLAGCKTREMHIPIHAALGAIALIAIGACIYAYMKK